MGSVKSVSSVREKDILRMRTRYPPCEKKIFSGWEELSHDPCQQPSRGNLTYHAPPCGGGEGGGASWGRCCGQLGLDHCPLSFALHPHLIL